jgi:3-deoxy-D-manno-octulosonate 8-phosphate phosphatase (KDO 8-P phosphatase)
VGLPVAVANARPEAKQFAVYVTQSCGGRGAVRELADWLLKREGKWDSIVARYGL